MRAILIFLLVAAQARAEPNCKGVNPLHYETCWSYVIAIKAGVEKVTKEDKDGKRECAPGTANAILQEYEKELDACKDKSFVGRVFLQGVCIEKASVKATWRLSKQCKVEVRKPGSGW